MRRRPFSLVAAAVLAFGLVGCAAYQQPGPGDPAVELRLVSTHSGTGFETYYWGYYDSQCTGDGGGLLATFPLHGSGKTVRLWPDRAIYLVARFKFASSMPGLRVARSCTSLVRFVPAPGHRYRASQLSTSTDCPIKLVDVETSTEPESLERLPLPAACSGGMSSM